MKKVFCYFALALLIGFVSCSDDDDDVVIDNDETIIIEDSKPSAAISASGFYVVNEDWFGWDMGSVNYFKNDGSIVYRAYRAANDGEKLGNTAQFATIYGGNVYFVSKQSNRFVVADAVTLKKKAVLTDIGGDGRSFVGINSEKGYIATLNGITKFDIKDFTVKGAIADISGQTGNMCLVGKYVFAIVQSKGLYIIDTEDDTVVKQIEATNFAMLTQSKDGYVWVGAGAKLIKVDPYTFETSEIDITDVSISGSWGAWNAGSLCASTKQNVLYWTKGTSVVKYDIDKKELNKTLYTLGKDEAGKQLAFYGAGLRVDPLTDKLVATVKRNGWGNAGSYNWVNILTADGALEKSIVVRGDNGSGASHGSSPTEDDNYYWFPAMPFFEDVNAPEILLNQIIVKPNERKAICLSDKIYDADNMSTSIIKSISYSQSELAQYQLKGDSLIVTASGSKGKTTLTIHANSNGKLVEKEVRVDIR